MTKKDEQKLAATAKQADRLRETITTVDRMLRSWKNRNEAKNNGRCYISFSSKDRAFNASGYVSSEFAEKEFIPVLERIRREALKNLRDLPMPGP